MNFGQMLLWHIVLLPIILIAHCRRARPAGPRARRQPPAAGHPAPAVSPPGCAATKADRAAWRGPTRRYDILKEGTIATVVILILTVGLASLLSSPNVPPATVRSWVQVDPADFLATAGTELNATSVTATHGPPYNTNGDPAANRSPRRTGPESGSRSTRRRPSCSDR